jgi:predicted P-loop ATPase
MAGPEFFSDQSILDLNDRAQQEAVAGIWIYEIADLTGIARADTDKVKAFASRTTDRARPAYGHFREDRRRRCIFIASTNAETYLKSQTGNRRFWPVKTGKIDLVAVRTDRDQLWAEAAAVEASGYSLVLPEELWGAAAVQQEARLDHDPWMDELDKVQGKLFKLENGTEEHRVATADLLGLYLKIPTDRQTDHAFKRVKHCMLRLNWIGPAKIVIFDREKPVRGFSRPAGGGSRTEGGGSKAAGGGITTPDESSGDL